MKTKKGTLKDFETKLNKYYLIEKSISRNLKGGNSNDEGIFKNKNQAKSNGG